MTVTQQESRQAIVIEPAIPDTVYVPYYDPAIVYGSWPYAAYPPYYFPPPLGYVPGAVLAKGIAFGAGHAVGRWASGGNNINVNRPVNINNVNVKSNNWQHNPVHRQGVQYSNTNVQQKFSNNNIRAGSQDRMDFRGRGGEQVIKPGAGGANLGGNGPASARRAHLAAALEEALTTAEQFDCLDKRYCDYNSLSAFLDIQHERGEPRCYS